jgi:hypothetical protein
MNGASGAMASAAGSAGGGSPALGSGMDMGMDMRVDAGAVPSSGTDSQPADGSAGVDMQDTGEQGGCTRELLASTVDAYFAALAAHDASLLQLADDVKATENGELLVPGEGLFRSAGMVRYKHSALDTELCTSVSEAVVPEGGTDLPVALRLKLAGRDISEIETIVARPGDYVIFGSAFASNPEAIVASASLRWEEPVPEAQRASRAEIEAWITRYFEAFPNGGCNLAEDCRRLENGGGSFSCSLGATCSASAGGGGFGGPMDARLVVVDAVTGVGVGFTMFMGNTDMHMIMLRAGEVHAVHAILSGADSSGWE